jgi:hypothetical protein
VTPLTAWDNFFVIVGSSAGALIGLQFVVLAVIADMPVIGGSAEANDAFATPTVVHFGTVLLLSGILSAPWRGTIAPVALCSLVGAVGLVYVIVVARRLRAQPAYRPVFEDWLFHVFLPVVAYGILGAASYAVRLNVERTLFGVAAAAFLLLFIGIHNAWDSVTYLVFVRRRESEADHGRKP